MQNAPRAHRPVVWREILLAVALFVPCGLTAQQPTVALHGFGSWGYGNTDGNRYLVASEAGDYANTSFALNLNARASDRLTVAGQVGWAEGNHDTVELDYAFGSWRLSDGTFLRVGKIKHPFAIYSEIQDVGTLRPFLTLPQSVYGPHGIVAKGFTGVGLAGSVFTDSGWGFAYDAYGGSILVELEQVMAAASGALAMEDELSAHERVTDMVGGRFTVYAPIPGVSFGFSGYTGELNERTGASNRQKTYGGFADVTQGGLTVRGEYFQHVLGSASDMNGWYVESSLRLPAGFQLAARYDRMSMDGLQMDGMDDMGTDGIGDMGGMDGMGGMGGGMATMASLMAHREVGIGLNYWFSDGLVVKASWHRVNGNRFAHPLEVAELMQAAMTDSISPRTSAFVVGAQFAY